MEFYCNNRFLGLALINLQKIAALRLEVDFENTILDSLLEIKKHLNEKYQCLFLWANCVRF